MNEILQKRIKEASIDYTMRTRPMCIAGGAFADMARELNKNPDFIAGANYALQNQWISVEEALPEEKYLVLTRVKTPVGIVYRSDYYINDYWYRCRYNQEEIVTHWALIPSLKGGEK